ncbi:MAG: hypothetical protein Q9162_001871 [Coniocarpon cinnabarinum]
MLPESIFIILAVATISLWARTWQHARHRRRHGYEPAPRYRHTDPFFGFDLFLKTGKDYGENRYLPELSKLFAQYGNTFEAISVGKRSIYTIEPENLRSIFVDNARTWGVEPIRLAPMEPFCGRGFLTVDGDLWHRSRRLFGPSFEKRAIADFTALESFVEKMLPRIPRDGSTVDMQPLLSSLFIDATTLFLFGESIGQLAESIDSTRVSKAFDEAMYGSGMRIAMGPLGFLAKSNKWLKACQECQSFADQYVQKAIRYRHELQSGAARRKQSKNILLYSLAENLDDTEFLRNNILQAFFVSQVLPQNNRVALANTTLPVGGGPRGKSPIYVAAGTMVCVSYYTLHRQERHWGPDAAQFKPTRWDDDVASGQAYPYLPFGAGPRQCIGREKALMEASYVLVRLLQCFPHIESRDSREWQGHVQLSAQNLHGCKVAFTAI